MALRPGDRVAERYRLLRPLGSGGMASVFLVEDERARCQRVLKELRLDQPELLDSFRREFSLLSSTTHPRLLRVHDFGTWRIRAERHHYYTADLVVGEPFPRWAARTKADSTPVIVDALSALAALHALNVRHGDVSPDNILVRSDGRGVLIDLGCARPFDAVSTHVAGTPGFIAPELLAGQRGDARSDLFSLGQTLRWVHGSAGVPLSGKLELLCQRSSAEEPAARPASARAALEVLGRKATRDAALHGVAPRVVGRDAELSEYRAWLRGFIEDEPVSRIFWLAGESGVGSSRLLREFVSLTELEIDVLRARGDEASPVSWLLASASGLPGTSFSAADVLRACQELSERSEPLLLVLEDAQRLDAAQADLLHTLLRALPERSRVACLVSASNQAPLACAGLRLLPLSLDALRALTLDTLSRGALSDLFERTRGYPARVEALRTAREDDDEPKRSTRATTQREVDAVIGTGATPTKNALALLLALGGETDIPHPLLELEALEPLLEAGWLRREGTRLRLGWRARKRGLEGVLSNEIQHAHRVLADWYQSDEPMLSGEQRLIEHIFHAARAGELARAKAAFAAARSEWRARPRSFAARLLPLFEEAGNDWLVARAELSLEAGDFPAVLHAVARVLLLRHADDSEKHCRLLAADALLRLGRPQRAERLLAVLSSERSPRIWRARALERCARARLQAGDPKSSDALARTGLDLAEDTDTARSLRELLGMSASYLGRGSEAEATFSELLASSGPETTPRERSRWLAQRAIARFRGGQSLAALSDYREALELADRHGLDDHFCVNCLNLGTAQQKVGDWGAALVSYERGLRVAHAIGRESSELTLRFNLANLLVEIGDFVRAESELEALSTRTGTALGARFAPFIALVRGEIAIERRDFGVAEREFAAARAGFGATGLERELAEVDVCNAELALARGESEAARLVAERALTAARKFDASDLVLRARAALARALGPDQQPNAVRELEALLDEADAGGERALSARLASELYRVELASGAPRAIQQGARAQRLWDQLGASLPESLREVFWRDPRRASLALRTRAERSSNADHEALHKLLSLSRRVNSSLSLERVFEYAVDAAMDLTRAERCFLLLEEGETRRIVAQRPTGSDLLPPSRAIVDRVVESDEAVLTTDAESDHRFANPGSIHSLKLKSVLCVPVLTPSERIGLLYVDNRVQRGRFQERERELLAALSDQVAVAVANARLHRALERQREELAEQKRLVERLSRAKDRELEKLRERVEEQQRSLSLRYDYSRIVGQSAAMRHVFAQLDRITDSSVDVLLQGESGTGKELVARALHQNGPRRAAPFVGINCAALPENLLESELFGHVRGAFTGADRDQRGLMLEANGGTLFLDEVAELPLSMQAKLLRVLQEREVRPVGGVRSVPLDVRVVSATHRDLRNLVESGRFREDLYYRLAVVVVRLPPLRERTEDVPLLARAILERLAHEAKRPVPELSSDARQRLLAHPFPGNVRELENTLTRAFVLSEGPRITGADLDLTKGSPRKASRTRREYEAEERIELMEALQRTRWNVSLVSRELGIPRNTLYRKLRRHGLLSRPEGS